MAREIPETLQQAEDALNKGSVDTARVILIEYVRRAPTSERAWWLLSFAVPAGRQQTDCLERVLRINPGNVEARRRLEKLKTPPPAPAKPLATVSPFVFDRHEEMEPEPVPPPAFAAPPPPRISAPPERRQAPPVPVRKKKPWGPVIFLAVVLAGVLAVAGYLGLTFLAQQAALLPQATLPPQTAQSTLQPTMTRMFISTQTRIPTPTRAPTWTSAAAAPGVTQDLTFIPTQMIAPRVTYFAPDFQLVDPASGETITLSQFADRPVLVFFWASWCQYCKEELSGVESAYEEYQDEGLIVIGISIDDSASTVTSFRSQHGIKFFLLPDDNKKVTKLYRTYAVPRNFFIRAGGRISKIGEGLMTADQMHGSIQALFVAYSSPTP